MREEGGREGGGREGRRGEGGKRVIGEVRERRRARKEKGEGREGGNEERRKGREERRRKDERGKRGNKTGVHPYTAQKFNKLHMNLYISCHREWFGSRNNTQASFLTLNGISHC